MPGGTVGGGAIAVYMAMAGMPGSGGTTGTGGVTGTGGMTGSITLYMGPMPPDAGQKDLGGAVALYMATMPDAGLPMRYSAPQPKQDAGLGPMPLYMAPMPAKN